MLPRRRHVVQALVGAATAPVLFPATAAARGKRKLKGFGVILGSVNKALLQDTHGTLQHLARLGYKEVEFGGPPKGVPAQEFKQMVADAGLKSVAGGAPMHRLNTDWNARVEAAQLFGWKYLVCYWPWADNGSNKQLDDWKRLADRLNELGAAAAAAGLKFAYHNHNIEFLPTEDQIPYDLLLAHTDPALVTMELDIYWIEKGGQQAARYIDKYKGRFSLFHVKDMHKTDSEQTVCVGDGKIPFANTFAALAKQPNEQHFFWELEQAPDAQAEMACAMRTARYLTQLRY